MNFIVSLYQKAWIPGSKSIFVAEPFVHHIMRENNALGGYEKVEVAVPLVRSEKELAKAHEYVDRKYNTYVPLLAERLNRVHKKNHDVFFWRKCLSLGLVRYITFVNQVFECCEAYFDAEKFDCRVLSPASYKIPANSNDQRELLQYTAYGQEQLFSIYVNLFYPNRFENFDDSFGYEKEKKGAVKEIGGKLKRITPAKLFGKISRIGNMLYKQYAKLTSDGPRIGIMGCFFSEKHVDELVHKSKGRIYPISCDISIADSNFIDWQKRKTLSETESGFDKFDTFFFSTIEHCLSKEFVEDFEQVESYYSNYFAQFDKLEQVVSETWIGDTFASIALAVLQAKGVRHIYNEHNYLSHQFLGKNNRYIIPVVDSFITLGWEDQSIPNLVKGGSLYQWTEPKSEKKEYEILMIDGLAMVKPPEYNAAYGDSGAACAQRFFDFNRLFFASLQTTTLSKIAYKDYPVMHWPISSLEPFMVCYNYNKVGLDEYLQQCKPLINRKDNSKQLIAKSRLVVINYLSTSYIEALMADVPLVFFWNKDNYYMNEEYADFYEPLVSAGICQTDPVKAALFIEEISGEPETWWQSKPVKQAREQFIANNLGSPKLTIDHLLKLAVAN